MVGEYGSDQRRHEKKQSSVEMCGRCGERGKMTDGVAVLGIYRGYRTALHRKLDFSSSQIQNS